MTIIRQGSLFGIQDLFDLEPTQRFEAVFSTIDLDSAVLAVSKKILAWRARRAQLRCNGLFFGRQAD